MTIPTNALMQVTSAGEWKRGELVRLPSGKIARLKKPDILSMVMEDGKIPDALTPLIFGKESQTAIKQGRNPEIELTPEVIVSLTPVLNKLAKGCFVEPRVVDKPGDDEIAPLDVEFNDKLFLFQWVFGEQGQAASRFPAQQVANAETLPDSHPNGAKTVLPVGN